MSKVQKKIIESSTYNLLNVVIGFLIGQLSTFAIARLISPEEWGFLLLALSFVNIAGFFSGLFPPGAEGTIIYYIPNLRSLDEDKSYEMRKFIFHNYKLRIISSSVGFIAFLIIIYFSNLEFTLFQITLILSPKILLTKIRNLNQAVFLAYQKFKFVFLGNLLMICTISFGNLSLFLLEINQPLLFITLINLLSSIIPLIVSIFFLIPLIPKKQKDSETHSSYDLNFYKLHKTYGSHLVLSGIFSQISGLVLNLIFLNSGYIVYIIYLSVCERGVTYALNFSSSNRSSYISIFAEINYQENPEIFKRTFYKMFKFVSLFVCIITAFLFYFMEVYITIIYSEIYLLILFSIQIYLFQTFSRLVNRNLVLIIQSTNNNKIISIFSFIQMIEAVAFTVIGILFFDFFTLVILYLISSYLLNIITILIINKIIGFRLKLSQLYYTFLLFLISFSFTFPFRYFVNFHFFSNPIIDTLLNSAILFFIFLVAFYLLIYLTKFITREEFSQLVNILPILSSKNHSIQRITKIMEKFFPTEKTQ